MDQKQDETGTYPPEFTHLGDKVRMAQERAQQIDEQIKNVPQNIKPQPTLKPTGFLQRRYFDRERTMASLQQQREDLKTETFSQVEQEVKDADPKTARQVRDQAREGLFPNRFRRMSIQEKNTFHNKPKDIEQSQDYMDGMFYSPKNTPQKEKQTKPEAKPLSMSLRFSQGLSAPKADEIIRKTAKLNIEPDKD